MFNNMLMGAAGASSQAGAYSVDNSATVNDDDTKYFKRTSGSAGNLRTWTVSFWWKMGKITTASTKGTLFSARSANPYLVLQTNDNAPIASLFFAQYNGSDYDFQIVTDMMFRDPHAFYNIVIAVDTTQASSTNRIKMYVNGSQVTFGTASYPAQNTDTYWNTTYEQRIGMDFGSQPLDGSLAEWVNIDGSALGPTSFGETDSNGVWRPVDVSGLTFGTNGFYIPFTDSSFLGLDNSATTNSPGAVPALLMHFDGSDASTTMTDSSPYSQSCTAQDNAQIDTAQYKFGGAALLLDGTNDRVSVADDSSLDIGSNDFTLAGWVRFNGSPSGDATFIAKWRLSSGQREFRFYYENSSSELRMVLSTTGSNEVTIAESWSPSGDVWYHLAASRTGGNIHLFVNGTQLGSGTSDSSTVNDAGHAVTFGCTDNAGPVAALDGWLDEWIFLNGTGIYSSNFTPPTSAYAINNSLIDINSPTQSSDSPTNNHCVWSPLTMNINASSSLALSSGNLVVSNTASEDANLHGSIGLSAGKWYFEVTVDTINEIFLGVSDATIASNANAKNEAGAFVLDLKNADKYNNDGGSSYGSAFTNGDVANVAVDLDNGKIWIGKDGTYPNSGDPAAGSNEMYSGISGTVFPFLSTQGGGTKQATANFGQSSFTTSAPSGFEPWNTSKMYDDAAPAIEDGTAYFQPTKYEGNGTAIGSSGKVVNQSGNSTFKPDFVWIKNRDQTDNHMLYDAVRGATKDLHSNSNAAQNTDTEGLSTFDSDGFTVGSNVEVNTNTEDYIAWQWKGSNTSGSTNDDGNIDSTVNVNTTAGFVVGQYTTPSGSAAVRTVGHGLGGALDMLFIKNQASGHWAVWHNALGNEYLRLNATDAKTSGGTETNSLWNATLPSASSTTFSIGTNSDVNGNAATFTFYGFRAIAGYSAFGSYEGNDANNGPYVYLGFKPAFLMVKNIDATGGWPMYDNARTPDNPSDKNLNADQNGAEYSPDYEIDLLSNGFKLRDDQAYVNDSNTYLYMAFAEYPFAGTTPAPAR